MGRIEDLKVSDVLTSEPFKKNLVFLLTQDYGRVGQRLKERGVWTAEFLTQLYNAVIFKSLNGFSANERLLIRAIGNEAYNKTINQWIDEKKDSAGRENRQKR